MFATVGTLVVIRYRRKSFVEEIPIHSSIVQRLWLAMIEREDTASQAVDVGLIDHQWCFEHCPCHDLIARRRGQRTFVSPEIIRTSRQQRRQLQTEHLRLVRLSQLLHGREVPLPFRHRCHIQCVGALSVHIHVLTALHKHAEHSDLLRLLVDMNEMNLARVFLSVPKQTRHSSDTARSNATHT